MAIIVIIDLHKGSGKRSRVREKSVKSQGILIWIMSGNPGHETVVKHDVTKNHKMASKSKWLT